MSERESKWYFCRDTNILVFILVIIFGIGSWVSVNGIFVELPILIHHLPEGSVLPSYLAVIVEIGNIGPLLFFIANTIWSTKINLKNATYLILLTGTVNTLLIGIFWNRTSIIGGVEHSTALMLLTFLISLADCSSAVVFLPYMALFKSQYLTGFLIGERLSGLIPSLVGIGQGAGAINCMNISVRDNQTNTTTYKISDVFENPQMSSTAFFIFLFVLMVLSIVAFYLLNFRFCSEERVPGSRYERFTNSELHDIINSPSENITRDIVPDTPGSADHEQMENRSRLTKLQFVYYLILVAWIDAATNGLLLSFQSFACLPYGAQPYHLSAILVNIANPCAGFMACFIFISSSAIISTLVLIGSGLAAYIFALASMSPDPPLVGTSLGSVLVVTAYALTVLLVTFAKVSIAMIFRREGEKALMWFGAMTRAGSTIGAVIGFLLINIVSVLEHPDPCRFF